MKNLLRFSFLLLLLLTVILKFSKVNSQEVCPVTGQPLEEPAETLEGNKGEEFPLAEPQTSSSSSSQTSVTSEPTSSSPESSPSGSSSGSSEPSSPKTWVDAVPKLPGYGKPSEGSPYGPPTGGGQTPAPPAPKGPMVNKGLMDKIRSTPRTPVTEQPQPSPGTPKKPTPTVPSGREECFLVVVETLTSNAEISEKAQGKSFPWDRQFEKEAFSKAVNICEEKFGKDNCSWAYECDMPRQVITEQIEDIYPEDGAARTPGIKTTVGIYFRCVPKPPESPFTSGTGGGSISLPPPSQPPTGDSGSSEAGSLGPKVLIINDEEDVDLDGTVPPEPPPEPPVGPKPPDAPKTPDTPKTLDTPQGPDAPKIPETPLPPKVSPGTPASDQPKTPASEKPSKCEECFKVVVEVPFSKSPFDDLESQWQEAASTTAEGICQETCSDKSCTFSIPCGDRPVEREDIYPENLYFDPTSGRVSEGIKTRIGVYYKCIAPIGERPKVPPETPKIPETPETPKTPETPQTPLETPHGDVLETPKEHVTDTPKEHVTDIPKEHVTDIPKEHVTDIPKEHVTDIPKEHVTDIPKEHVTDTPKEEECDCKYLDQEWVIGQTIKGDYVYIPDPKINYKIPIEGYKRRVELKAKGSDEDILVLRAEKTKNGERVCVRSKNVFSPDLIKYDWEIIAGPGNFKNGGRTDKGEAVIYIPPEDLPFGEHIVVIETVIDDVPGKAPDQENKGKIRMLIKHREEEPDFYFIDFGISDFAPVGGSIPPELPCACEISTEWKEEVPLTHNIVIPAEGTMYCPECTDVWVGNGSDVDRLIVHCKDPECGEDIQEFPIVDVWTHYWAAHFGSYLDGNAGRKVLYKAPKEVPPVPIPNEGIILNTRDSGRQFVDEKPEPDRKKITIVDLDLVIHKPPVIDPAESEISEEDEFTKGSQTFVNLDNDDRDARFDTGTTDFSVAGEDEMVKLTLRLKPNTLDKGTVSLEALTGSSSIQVWRQADKTTEYVLGMPLAVPTDFTVNGEWLETVLYVEGIQPHTDQRQTRLQMIYDLVPDCTDEVALTVIGIDKIEWIGKNNSVDNDNNLKGDPNFPAGLGVNALRVFPDARMAGGAVEGGFRDRVDVKVTLTVKPIEAVNIYFDSFDVDDPTSDHAPVDNEAVNQDNRGGVPDRTGQFEGEIAWIKEQTFDEKEETLLFQVTHQPGDNFRVVGNGDPDFLNNLDNRDAALGANNADKLRIVNKHVTGTPADREVREPTHYVSDVLTVWRFLHIEIDSMGVVTGNDVRGEVVDMTPRDSATAVRLDVSNNLDDGSPNLSDVPPANGRFENGQITFPGNPAVSAVQGNGRDFVRNAARFNMVPLPFTAEDNDWWDNSTFSGTLTSITHNGVNWVLQLNITAQSDPVIDWPDFIGGEVSISGGTGMDIAAVFPALSRVEVRYLNLPYILTDDDVIAGDVASPDTGGMAVTYAPAYIVPLFDTGKDTPDAPFILNSPVADMPDQINASKGTPLSVDHYWVATVLGAYQTNAELHPKWHGDNDPDSERTSRAVSFRDVHGALFGNESIRDWIATPLLLGGNGVDPAGAGRQPRHQEILNHEIGHLFGLEHNPHGDVTADDPQGGVMLPSCCPPDNPASGTRGVSTFSQRSLSIIRDRDHPGF